MLRNKSTSTSRIRRAALPPAVTAAAVVVGALPFPVHLQRQCQRELDGLD